MKYIDIRHIADLIERALRCSNCREVAELAGTEYEQLPFIMEKAIKKAWATEAETDDSCQRCGGEGEIDECPGKAVDAWSKCPVCKGTGKQPKAKGAA